MLRIDNMTMKFGGVIAANQFDAHIGKGELVGLIGPNGAGKTTVFNVITGVYKLRKEKSYLVQVKKSIS